MPLAAAGFAMALSHSVFLRCAGARWRRLLVGGFALQGGDEEVGHNGNDADREQGGGSRHHRCRNSGRCGCRRLWGRVRAQVTTAEVRGAEQGLLLLAQEEVSDPDDHSRDAGACSDVETDGEFRLGGL